MPVVVIFEGAYRVGAVGTVSLQQFVEPDVQPVLLHAEPPDPLIAATAKQYAVASLRPDWAYFGPP